MDAKELVDSLFEGYDQTAALADFKEELLSNFNAKVESLVKKGMDAASAFAKASAELGDVSALADELSLKKRKEIYEEVYMDINKYMNAKRVAAYVIFGVLAAFGIVAAAVTFFAVRGIDMDIDLTSLFAVMLPFLTVAIAGFTWLGVTQETASDYPVSKKRGAWYAAAAALIGFGLLIIPVVFFGGRLEGSGIEVLGAISVVIPFLLPGIGMLVFLVLTEKDRLKPWAKDLRQKTVQREMEIWQDPVVAARFGMISGAIWIFALGLFLLLGFLLGFNYSWLVFIFAVAIQLLVQGLMGKRENRVSTIE